MLLLFPSLVLRLLLLVLLLLQQHTQQQTVAAAVMTAVVAATVADVARADAAACTYSPSCPLPSSLVSSSLILPPTSPSLPFPLLPFLAPHPSLPLATPPSPPSLLPLSYPSLLSAPLHPVDCCVARPTVGPLPYLLSLLLPRGTVLARICSSLIRVVSGDHGLWRRSI